MTLRNRRRTGRLALLLLTLVPGAGAIVTEDIPRSESNPSGYAPYTGFDWSFVYRVGGASGVAVASHWILTARHVTPGDITVGSLTYHLLETVAHPDADIRLARYDQAFPGYYPIYTGAFPGIPAPEHRRLTGLMVGFGRTGDVPTSTTYTWHGAETAGAKRWGDARIDALGNHPDIGDYFVQPFNTAVTSYAAGAADKDSGGGVFVYSDGAWRLAGVMVSVIPDTSPYTGTVSVRLPSYAGWIVAVIPEPATGLSLLAGAVLLGTWRRIGRRWRAAAGAERPSRRPTSSFAGAR